MYFAIINFIFSGIIGIVGIKTLRKVSAPEEVIFASLPLLFALHEFTQGFVWLGVYGHIEPRALEIAESIFVFYAQGLLQFLVPLAIWLIEPKGFRRDLIAILMIAGALLSAYTLWGLSVQPTTVYLKNHLLVYVNPTTDHHWIGVIYALTTCGSLLLSRDISIQLFGWLNFFGINLVYWITPYALTSLWCLYAAIVSTVLYLHFVKRRIAFLEMLKKNESRWGQQLQTELYKLADRYPNLMNKLK
ncbi:DUF6629 family protein [Sulfurimonas sp. HSL-1716]|uniref:DUF6629 family protein n=1 Tax=Hydrocurvibacter sulfurireducens TaxID=3131937 RepID=UPI0031F8C2E2